MEIVKKYKVEFEEYLNKSIEVKKPRGLYSPIHYIIGIGGKRLRPILTLWSCELFGGSVNQAYSAALAVEVFHNFTLIHDDIMDSAPVRRGQTTVHEKWDVNTGILSGDAMMILAYRYLEEYQGTVLKRLLALFNKTALEVCEGQQMDMDFETEQHVSIDDYLTMIELKTSVLIGAAMKMGAIIAGVDEMTSQQIYDFGRYLGMAFQLQDDYLDTFGNSADFGKRIGGDIEENKKTFLYLKTLQLADNEDARVLNDLYSAQNVATEKIKKVTLLFEKYNIKEHSLQAIEKYTTKAFSILDTLDLSSKHKTALHEFGKSLMQRTM